MRIETIPTYDRIKRLSEPITIVFSNEAVIRLRRPTPDEWNRYREKALRILAKGVALDVSVKRGERAPADALLDLVVTTTRQ